jgi:hypothetical protein
MGRFDTYKNGGVMLVFLLMNLSILQAQAVCGAEIEKQYYFGNTQQLYVKVQVCRQGSPVDFLPFDWGDGHLDSLPLSGTIGAGNGYIINFYLGIHQYEPGINEYVELKITPGQIIDDFVNMEEEASSDFVMKDSILIFTSENSPIIGITDNESPDMAILSPTNYEQEGWYESLQMYQVPYDFDSLSYALADFPVEGYFPPATNGELFIDEYGIMYWDRPLVPGKYAVAAKVREVKWTSNPVYNQQWTMVSTITKAFMIIVNSASLVTTVPAIGANKILSIYPNPATTTSTLEYGGLNGETNLKVINAQGQIMLQKTLNGTAQIQREVIDVSTWPAGVYWIELRNEAGQVTKKLVVE